MKLDDETLSQMKHLFQEGHTIKQIADMYNLTYRKVKWAFDSRGWKSTHKQFHGGTNTRLYRIHKAMKTRCYNPNFHAYKYYGGKGIRICDEWDDFSIFREWALLNGYEEGLTIDRINSNRNYEPGNCRWISISDQQKNKENNIRHLIEGEYLLASEIAEIYGINESTIWGRFSKGAKGDELIEPVRKSRKHIIRGEEITLEEASIKYNIPWSTLRWRYGEGVRGDKLIEKQPRRRMAQK